MSINWKKIYLFDDKLTGPNACNSLKHFIYYLKSKGINGVIDFTYSGDIDSLHQELTIKENFILDSIPTSLIRDKENNLKTFLASIQNPHLVEMIKAQGDLGKEIRQLSPMELKMASITKALLSTSEYVFLVKPEHALSIEQINLLKRCIVWEVTHNAKKIFITPQTNEAWMDIATNIISKCETSSNFIDYKNPLTTTSEESAAKETEEIFKKAG